jgi:hypothetical protein
MSTEQKVEIKPGDKVVLSFWSGQHTILSGTVDQIFPCDGNACEEHVGRDWDNPDMTLLETDPCDQDYLGIVEDDQMVYFRSQVASVNGVEVPGGGE